MEMQGMTGAAKRWLVRGIVFGLLLILVCVVVFGIIPSVHAKRINARFEVAAAYVRDKHAEAAVAEYLAIAQDYAGSEAARRAQAQVDKLNPIVVAAMRLNDQAEAALRGKEFERAWRLYKQLAEEFSGTRKGGWAIRSAKGAAKLACDSYWEQGVAAEKEYRWEDAKGFYGKITGINPDYPGGREALKTASGQVAGYQSFMAEAALRVQAKDWLMARSYFEAAIKIQPKDVHAYQGYCLAIAKIPPPKHMAVVPPGDYVIGADDGEADEQPLRTVRAEGFYLDVNEVTNQQYGVFVRETGHPAPPHWGGKMPPREIAAYPVVCVSWYEASAYAKWAGKRLPTEEEWECAARGPEGLMYPWGNVFAYGNGVFARSVAPAGSRPKDCSALGVMDLAGNVSEWTATKGEKGCSIRGGSWLGFEQEREDRAVADDIARVESDPQQTLLIDAPAAWGLTVRGVSEVKFFLRGSANWKPVIEIRRFIPSADQYAAASFVLEAGDAISGIRDVKMEVDGEPENLRVKFETGCTLNEVITGDKPEDMAIEYTDRYGKRGKMKRMRPDPERPPLGRLSGERTGTFDAVLKAVQSCPLARLVRSANRMSAPPDARFINCGFRCAKDLSPSRPLP